MTTNDNNIILKTKCWLDNFIIAYNICPFAKKERDRGSIRFCVDHHHNTSDVLENLMLECEYLEDNSELETSLFILAESCQNFDDYLELLEYANQLLVVQNYEGVFQLASFHPEYCFADTNEDDPSNYTNRSPYPMLHIIREESLEKALQTYPNPESIPQRNIQFCEKLGLQKMQEMFHACRGKQAE